MSSSSKDGTLYSCHACGYIGRKYPVIAFPATGGAVTHQRPRTEQEPISKGDLELAAEEVRRRTEEARKVQLEKENLGFAKLSYTGFLFQEGPGLFHDGLPPKTTMLDWTFATQPWYARLLGLVRLPYDFGKFVVTGRLIILPWPWRW